MEHSNNEIRNLSKIWSSTDFKAKPKWEEAGKKCFHHYENKVIWNNLYAQVQCKDAFEDTWTT
jgi:hypothetical protein